MSYNAKSDQPPRMPDAQPNRCVAHGCPLRATIFDSVIGPPQNGRCQYHDALAPKFWAQLTEAMNRGDVETFEALGLKWREPIDASKRSYYSKHTGITVRGAESFKLWWQAFSARPPVVEHADVIGSFVRIGALTVRDPEWDEERRAIQAENEPV